MGTSTLLGVVEEALAQGQEVIKILERLRPGTGFEKMVLRATVRLVERCLELKNDLIKILERCRQDWSLLELSADTDF